MSSFLRGLSGRPGLAARTRRSRPHSYQWPPRLGGARSPRVAASLAALFSVECLKTRTRPERRPGSVWPFRGRRPCSGCALPDGGNPRRAELAPPHREPPVGGESPSTLSLLERGTQRQRPHQFRTASRSLYAVSTPAGSSRRRGRQTVRHDPSRASPSS